MSAAALRRLLVVARASAEETGVIAPTLWQAIDELAEALAAALPPDPPRRLR